MDEKQARKILVSPGFGAGWSTWAGKAAAYVLTYQPIIDFLEKGGKASELVYDFRNPEKTHPLLQALIAECKEKFDEDLYCGGAQNLQVETVNRRVRVHEYDGSESVEEEGEYDSWL